MPEELLCARCTALCCRYFALQIDTPKAPSDFDDIRWYLLHENVHVFIEDGLWYLAIQTRCQNLQQDNRCGQYEDRPRICREYSTENCDFHIGAYEFEQYFTQAHELEAYAQAKLGKKYTRYVMTQRAKNVGKDGRATRGLDAHAVLASRKRPRVMGHPSARRSRRSVTPTHQETPVSLSISAANR